MSSWSLSGAALASSIGVEHFGQTGRPGFFGIPTPLLLLWGDPKTVECQKTYCDEPRRDRRALLGFWVKGCFVGAQFLDKRPDSVDRSLIGDATGYATKKLDPLVEFDAFFTHGAARQNYLPHYDDFVVNWLRQTTRQAISLRTNCRELISGPSAWKRPAPHAEGRAAAGDVWLTICWRSPAFALVWSAAE
jgi:hypothetical protein